MMPAMHRPRDCPPKASGVRRAIFPTIGLLLSWAVASRAAAQDSTPPPADGDVPPEARAGDDAFQRFLDAVLALRLSDGRATVATLLAASDLMPTRPDGGGAGRAERELRRILLEQAHRGAPSVLGSGGVEIDLWLPTARLAEILQELAAGLAGVDRSRVALDAKIGPSVTATGVFVPDGRPRDDRPGWRHCTPEQIAQARAAAEFDLRRHILARLADLRPPGGRPLREMMAARPRLRDALAGRVQALRPGVPMYEPTGVCRVVFSITRKTAADLLREAAAESREALPDADRMAEALPAGPVILEGLAVPPPESPSTALAGTRRAAATAPAADAQRPAWAERFLRVQAAGRLPPGVGDEALRRDLAARAARVEAERLLWLEIEKLPLGSGTVGDRLAGSPGIHETAAAIDALIIPVANPVFAADGTVSVVMGIRLESVWDVLRGPR
jgi:hypothetical protein